MTITRTLAIATAVALAATQALSAAAETAQSSKGPHRQPRHHVAKTVNTQPKSSVQYGNNTRDSSYGGVYGENSFKGE
jgi:Spy/CpxP family protein refolding chaperone